MTSPCMRWIPIGRLPASSSWAAATAAFLPRPSPASSSASFRSSSTRTARQKPKEGRQSALRAKSKKKKGTTDSNNGVFRADRVLSQRTDMSRKECFDLLQKKRIWQKINADDATATTIDGTHHAAGVDDDGSADDVNGWIAVPGPSSKLRMNTPLWIDQTQPVRMPPPLLMVYHKPKWVLSVTKDPHLQRPCLDDNSILPSGMHPVGRLDYDSSGLLLFSSSGALTQRLLHPKHEIAKVYQVVVTDRVDHDQLKEQLSRGVKTGEGIHTAELLSVEHFADGQVAPYLDSVRAHIPTHYNQTDLEERGYLDIFKATALSTVSLRVREGKYRMVRRIMANSQHPVVTLVRRQFGQVRLNDLPEGSVRHLTQQEEDWARSIISEQ